MSEATKASDTKTAPQTAPEPDKDNHYSLKTSADAPEMALLPGGLFVMSIPLQAKGITKPISLGWALMGVFRIYELYNDFERLQKEHKSKIIKGDSSMIGKLKNMAGFKA